MLSSSQSPPLETPFFRTGGKRRLPGVAMAARAIEKFAVVEAAAATNRDTSNVGPGLLARWHSGSLAGFQAPNRLGAHAGVRGKPCAVSFLDAILKADRHRVAAIHRCPAAFDKQASLIFAARHDRPLAPIEDECRQLRLLNFALTGLGRVGEDVAIPPPHGSGRAGLPQR
jgi:hypothetical protein